MGRNQIEAKFRDQSVDFLEWAAAYIDQLDPLSATARNPDQLPEPTHYYHSDDGTSSRDLRIDLVFIVVAKLLRKSLAVQSVECAKDRSKNVQDAGPIGRTQEIAVRASPRLRSNAVTGSTHFLHEA